MKINMPVTDHEVCMSEGQTLVSKTNLKGITTYVNPDFIAISGYSEQELIGKNHNVVRHPDMPPAAFQDLWDTIKAGRPWNGIVKNRCKNGDFYWVNANVIPITENGRIVEYMSVRSKPTQEMIRNAEALYKQINDGDYSGPSLVARLKQGIANLSVTNKLLSLILLIAIVFGVGAVNGLSGLKDIENDWEHFEEDDASRMAMLQQMKAQFGYGGAIHNFKNYVLRGGDKYYSQTKERLNGLFDVIGEYRKLDTTSDQELKALTDIERVAKSYQSKLSVVRSMHDNDRSAEEIDQAVKINDGPALAGFKVLDGESLGHVVSFSKQMEAHISASEMSFVIERVFALIFMAILLLFFVKRAILKPLDYLLSCFKNINEGQYENPVDILRNDDIGQFMQGVHVTQVKLRFEIEDSARLAREATRIKNALDVCKTNVMVADNDFNIIYLNDSVQEMFSEAEENLKADLPNFNASQLLGANADVFHKNPAHQRGMVEGLSQPYESEVIAGGHTFSLVATPVFDESQTRLGTVIEWDDRTEEIARAAEEQRVANENARMKQALDSVSANVMVADADLNVIYMNDAVVSTLRNAEAAIQTELTHFAVDKVIGSNIDIFHKNPAHQRKMLESLTAEFKASIEVGGRHMDLVVNPIVNASGERIGTVVEWDDQTENLIRLKEERRVANENARMKQALDTVSANVMVADGKRNIIYMNQAVTDTLSAAENDLRKELSNFSVNNLIGNSIDVFHKNPAHQAQMLDALTGEHKASIVVGGRHMDLVVNPIANDEGERIGTVVEWDDRTNEVAIEMEVDRLVFGAANGDLSKRIDPTGKTGFFAKLAEGLNQTVESADSFLNDMGVVLAALAKGDLSKSISADYKGSFGTLKSDVNSTVGKLTEIITQIRESTSMVHEAANEISQGNADLSARTESQASSLEETAASMEEITSTVKESAVNAQEANVVTRDAKEKAMSGGEVVHGAVDAMKEILASSHKINDIIGVIDEIAFQTNLLALNAAVEAARAGEHGRGFAVVAGEVRTLSQRSASAAKEIKDLIRESVTKVESGSTLVNQSGETLSEIVTAVEKVAVKVEEITTAAAEQNDGIGQINQAVMQMDDMTQQNAALVEEASASSEALSEQASALNRMVAFFSVGSHGAALFDEPSAEPVQTYTAPASAPSQEYVAPAEPEPAAPVDTGTAPQEDQVIKYSNSSGGGFDDDWEEF